MLQAIVDAVSDLATLIAQQVVGYIAERSSIKKDGIAFFLVKIVVSIFVYLVVVVGIPLAVVVLVFKLALPLLLT
ncbi:MAG: hypothetical protein FWC58_12140 [Desulfobulbus sp.]|nr:hypothetical protein [Desulfobulbus sp.]